MSFNLSTVSNRFVLAIALVLALGACAKLGTTRGATVPVDLPLTALPTDANTLVWRASKQALPTRYYLAPVVWELPPSQQRLVNAHERAVLEAGLLAALEKGLADYQRLNEAQAGAVTVRATVTGLDRSNPAANVALSLLLGPVDTGGAAVNVLLESGGDGQALAALATSKNGRMLSTKGFSRWGHAQQAFTHAGKQLAPLFAAVGASDAR